MRQKLLFLICLALFFCTSVFAQTHTSVHLQSQVYHILENAALRGLIAPLSGVRPYTQFVIVRAINEILNSENARRGLSAREREILRLYLDHFSPRQRGLDWQRGLHRSEAAFGSRDIPLSFNLGVNMDMEGSAGFYRFSNSSERHFGYEVWLGLHIGGDLGRNVSWFTSVYGGMTKAPRRHLGWYNTFYEGFMDYGPYQNRLIPIYSDVLSYLPFTYRKRWDGSIHPFTNLASFDSWPNTVSGGRALLSEVSASLLDNKLFFRMGRISHEWGSTPVGSSLALNKMSRPFLAMQGEFWPVPWFGVSTMTGVLEFFNTRGEKISGMTFQNAYSITMLQFRFRNYLFLDLGEAVVWPRRFELGYMFPLTSSIVYKHNVGDFDNLSAHVNIRAQYPGLGSIWFSLFWDEAFWVREWNQLDRTMIAWQTGIILPLPVLSFSSLRFSYTRINPFTYSHVRNFTPWHGGNIPMEQAYVNNGVSLGHYLPPNSDEFLASFRTMPSQNVVLHLQYQLIRRGADFGSSAVTGSNLQSELTPWGRDGSNPITRRFFLRDGAYQWMHIMRANATWNLPNLPVSLFGEVGVNFSYFTNIDAPANITGQPHSFQRINTSEYPQSTGIVARLGVRVFPRR